MQCSWIALSLLVSVGLAIGCYLPTRQDNSANSNHIQVIHLPASEENLEDSDQEVIEIHIPSDDRRRKREVHSPDTGESCKTDADCLEGWYCDELLICHSSDVATSGAENVLQGTSHATQSVIIPNITYKS
ncbi:uncharacterized protein [Fopius arisanus]|uniref:Uncharacterized protein n=2 Tax=Fopius arisanus TaxID=64838 RepID=A0A9R1TSF3_9HYME|nr:PREDICTED: uncharacterized protein LOC105273851 [Fopius arisanus]